MSHILEMLGRGLEHDVGDVLDRYFWSPTTKSIDELAADCRHEPQRADLHLKLALAYLRSARLDEAIEHLRQATTIDPDDIGGRLALASAYEEAGDPARALEALRAANQIRPGEAPILFAIGFCLEKLRQPAEAAEYYRDAIDRGDGMLPARQRLAAVDMVLGDLDEAIVQHEAMLRERPDESWIYGTLGYLYHRKGRCAEAVSAFETAIAIEPENWSLIDDEVEALVANGQTRNAIDRLHQLIENQGPFADLRVRLADLYSHLGDDRGAMQFYLDAIDVEPHYLEAFVKLGSHHLAFGRWEEAAEAFGAAVELNDSLLLNYVGLGVAHAAAGSAAEAANSFELAEAVEPNSTILLTEMARLQMKAAAADEFARAFDSETAPQSPDIELDNDHLISKQPRRAGARASGPRRREVPLRRTASRRRAGRGRDGAVRQGRRDQSDLRTGDRPPWDHTAGIGVGGRGRRDLQPRPGGPPEIRRRPLPPGSALHRPEATGRGAASHGGRRRRRARQRPNSSVVRAGTPEHGADGPRSRHLAKPVETRRRQEVGAAPPTRRAGARCDRALRRSAPCSWQSTGGRIGPRRTPRPGPSRP